jgi:hypothetical protein
VTRPPARLAACVLATSLAVGLPACHDAEPAPPASRVRSEERAEHRINPRFLDDESGAPLRSALGVAQSTPSTTPSARSDDPVDDSEPALFRRIEETFGRKGEVKAGVYRLVTPRSDLAVTMDGRDVATAAFLESDFRFWRCPCGKLLVNGQFVLADYESNDVVNELQKGHLHVVSIGPLLLHEQPRLLMVRFQGEGDAASVAGTLRSALSYTGEERSKPLPVDLSPPHE